MTDDTPGRGLAPMIHMGNFIVNPSTVEAIDAYKRLSDIAPMPDKWVFHVRPDVYYALRHRGKHVKAKMIERFRLTGKRVKR